MQETQIILQSRPIEENEFLFCHNAQLNYNNLSSMLEYISSKTNLKFEIITPKDLAGRTYNVSHGVRVIEEEF